MDTPRLLVDSCVFLDCFDPQSINHADSLALLNNLREHDRVITMPAHGWFEIQCTFQLMLQDGRFVAPEIHGHMNCPVDLIHIDGAFVQKYSFVDMPYIKGGDHIFLAVAKLNGWPLISSDGKMLAVANQCGVKAFHPKDLAHITRNGT